MYLRLNDIRCHIVKVNRKSRHSVRIVQFFLMTFPCISDEDPEKNLGGKNVYIFITIESSEHMSIREGGS
jgi:hypothetical protein